MMIRWYGIALSLLTSCCIFGMDRYAIIAKPNENNQPGFQLHLVETNPPKITLDGCAFCKQNGAETTCNFCKYESTVFCGQCEGVYYCSAGCKQGYRDSHQEDCQKIQQAHYGDLDRIENLIQANMNQFKKTKKEKYFQEVLKWYSRKAVRLLVDSACSTKPETKEKVNISIIPQDHLNLLIESKKDITRDGLITQEKLALIDNMIEQYLKALHWTKELIDKNELVSPHGILRYGDYYLKESASEEELPLIPKDQWKEKRLYALEENSEEMKKFIEYHEKVKEQYRNTDMSDSKQEEIGAPEAIA